VIPDERRSAVLRVALGGCACASERAEVSDEPVGAHADVARQQFAETLGVARHGCVEQLLVIVVFALRPVPDLDGRPAIAFRLIEDD
jgi:hypothetical protein